MRLVLGLLTLTGALLLGASFMGGLHAAGDSLAVFRPQIGLLTVAVALGLGLAGRRVGFVLAALALGGVAPLWQGQAVAPSAPLITHYQKNLSFRLTDPAPLIADIRAASPDTLSLQEVTATTRAVLDALAEDYPTQIVCPFARVGAVALASRWSATGAAPVCLPGQGLVAMQLDGPRGPIWLVSVHLHWPWPHRQPQQRAHVLDALKALEGPVLLGGDFNMVPWSHAVAELTRAAGGVLARPVPSTYPRWGVLVPLPIDHVISPGGGLVERRPLLGSDHHGLLVRIDDWTASIE
jgi:endonuclease/exonuclease/phosphatase (EEP) superfamily protein YafD